MFKKKHAQLHKNATSIEQVLEAASHKTAAVLPPTNSRKPSKLDKKDTQDTAVQVRVSSLA